MPNNWIFRIWFSDGTSFDEGCLSKNQCMEKADLAMEHGYLIKEDKHFTRYPSQSIVKFEYYEED